MKSSPTRGELMSGVEDPSSEENPMVTGTVSSFWATVLEDY